MYQHEFTGRAPSIVQVRAQIKKAVAAGHDWIQLQWGENQITLEKNYSQPGAWYGQGWIRRIGGYDLASELSRAA
jgi:hypothetical protein